MILKSILAASFVMALSCPAPASSAPRDIQTEESNRKIVLDFFTASDAENQFKHVSDDYKQHNPNIMDGKKAVQAFFAELNKNYPNTKADIIHTSADGDLVWVHAHVKGWPDERGHILIDIFRVKDGKIVEHWDVVQRVPESSVSSSMFTSASAPSGPRDTRKEEENKALVLSAYDLIFNKHDVDGGIKIMRDDYKQHNPTIENGKAAFASFFKGLFEKHPNARTQILRSAADGDLVWIHTHLTLGPDDRGQAVVDIFRVEDGKLAEHWDAMQPVPEKAINPHPMF